MTEFELVNTFISFQGLLQGWTMAYFSGLTAYLVAAYLVGTRLDRSQVVVVNLLFVVYSGLCIYGSLGNMRRMLELQAEIQLINPNRLFQPSSLTMWIMMANAIAGMILSLKFMWDVRRRGQASAGEVTQPA